MAPPRCFLASLVILLEMSILSALSFNQPKDVAIREDLNVIRKQYETTVSTMLSSLRRAHLPQEGFFSRSGGLRARRGARKRHQVYDDRGLYRLIDVTPAYPLCNYARHTSVTTWRNDTYGVCISASGSATLGRLDNNSWRALAPSWRTGEARRSVVFHAQGALYIITADSLRADGADLLRWKSDTSDLELDHTVHCKYATAIALWKMNSDEEDYHLAIANSKGPSSVVYSDYTYTYSWKGSYFDQYSFVRSNDVSDLEAFQIHDHVFLAVANRRATTTSYDADSEIFRLDQTEMRWRSYQKLRTQAVSDIQFFHMGSRRAKEFFLIVANQFETVNGQRNFAINSVIYKYVESRFVPFQSIPTHGATSVSAFSDDSGAFVLAVANLYAPVQLFQYDGWNFVLAGVQGNTESMEAGVQDLNFFLLNGFLASKDQLALVVSNPRKESEVNVFSLTLRPEAPLSKWYSDGFEWCRRAQERLNDTMVTELPEIMGKAYYVDQTEPIRIRGPITFQGGLTVPGTIKVPKLEDKGSGTVFDHDLLFKLDLLNERLSSVKNRIHNFKSRLDLALRTSGSQVVSGHYEFESFSSSCSPHCQLDTVHTNVLNGNEVSNIATEVVFLYKPNIILGSLNIEELHVEGDISVTGLIDGVNSSSLVTKHSAQKIFAHKTFQHTLTVNNIIVQGTVDNVQISPETVLLTEGNQVITGEVTWTDVEVQDIEVEGTVTGINLHEFYEDVVLLDSGPQVISGEKVLKGPVTFDNLQLETARMNGIHLGELWNQAVWLDSEQTINAQWNFSHLHLVNPTVSSINGLEIPGPEIVSAGSGPMVVPAFQRFLSDVTIDRLEVEDSINGIGRIQDDLNECPNQLDILLKSCDQTIYGSKTFLSLGLGGNSVVAGLVNGFDLAEFSDRLRNKQLNLTGEWTFNQVEVRAPILVREKLVGWPAQKLYNRALKLGQPFHPNAHVTFRNLVEIQHLRTPNLNGINVERDLLLRTGNGVVSGIKHWQHVILLEHANVAGAVNGIQINFLADALRNSPFQQVLHGHRVIEGDLIVQDLDLGGFLSDLDLSKVIPLDATLILEDEITLRNVKVNNGLLAYSAAVPSGLINGQVFASVLNDTMLYNLPQQVLGRKTIIGQITVPEGSDFNVDFINGLSFDSLARDTLYQDEPQTISGKKTFASPVHFDNLYMNGTIHGVSVLEMLNDWLLRDSAQTMKGNVVFNEHVKVDGNVNVEGLVNGLDVRHLERDIIKTDDAFHVSGDLRLGSADVRGNIDVSGQVQGVDLSEDAVLKFANNVIEGQKRFRNMLIDGDLTIQGDLNGVDVVDLCQFAARRGGELSLGDLVVRGNVKITGYLNPMGLLNGRNINDFKNDVVFLDDWITFNEAIFNEVLVEQPLTLLGRLNDFDLGYLESNYMSLTRDQQVEAFITFLAPVTCEGFVQVDHLDTPDGMINDLNLTHFAHHVLKSVGEQTVFSKLIVQGNLHFMQQLETSSPVMGVNVPEDLALLSRRNIISGPVEFLKDLTVQLELNMEDAALQGVRVSEWARQTVMVTGKFTLTGKKILPDIHVQDVRAMELFGGINVSESSILLNNVKQVAKGKISFGKSLQVDGPLQTTSTINGLDIGSFLREAVVQGRPSRISGRKTFLSPVTVSRLSVHGFVAGVNVTELHMLTQRPYDLESLHMGVTESRHSLALFDTFLSNGPKLLSYYEEWLGWNADADVLAWDYWSHAGFPELFFISRRIPGNPGCSRLSSYILDSNRIVEKTILPTSFAVSLKAFSMFGTHYLLAANIHSNCNNDAGGLLIFTFDATSGVFSEPDQLTPAATSDVSVLQDESLACLASAAEDGVFIYCLNKNRQTFDLVQTLRVVGVLKVSFERCREGIFLAASAFSNGVWLVHIFAWDGKSLIQVQHLPAFQHTSGPLLFSYVDQFEASFCLLVVAEGQLQHGDFHHSTSVFRYDQRSHVFQEMQRIGISGIVDAKHSILPSGELLLTFLTTEDIRVLKWKGYEGFSFQDTLHFHGGRNLLTFDRHPIDPGRHYIAVSGRVCSSTWWDMETSTVLILRSKLKGI